MRNLKWTRTGSDVWGLEAFERRQFFGWVSATSSRYCWSWHCFAGQGEAPSARAARACVEAYVRPIFRYAQSTTWGDNTHCVMELHPQDGAINRAAGRFEHARGWYERLQKEMPSTLLLFLDVRPFKRGPVSVEDQSWFRWSESVL